MGNKPKPAQIRLLEGNRGHRSIPDNPKPLKPNEFPEPPDWLDGIGKEEWKKRGTELYALGLITIVDLPLFAGVCDNFSRYIRAKDRVDKLAYYREFRISCIEFGMSPVARVKLDVKPNVGKPSKMEGLIQ